MNLALFIVLVIILYNKRTKKESKRAFVPFTLKEMNIFFRIEIL